VTANWPGYPLMPGYPVPRRRASGTARVSVLSAYVGVVLIGLAAGGVVLVGYFWGFDSNGASSKMNEGLLGAIPNIAVMALLTAGADRLGVGRTIGRWLLAAGAVADVALAVAWGIFLDRHHGLAAFVGGAWILVLPAVLAAILAWTSSARRWTSRPDQPK